MKKLKWIIPLLLIAIIAYLLFNFWKDSKNPYTYNLMKIKDCDFTVSDNMIPKFYEAKIDFTHQFDKKNSLPVMAASLIDINNDGIDELFIGGGNTQNDGLFEFVGGKFKDISNQLPDKTGNSLGAISYDFNQDGLQDLLVTRDDKVFALINKNGSFESQEIDVHLNEKSSPVSLTLGDINNDGFIDMFVSGYIKKELMEGQTIFNDKKYGGSSVLLLNNGDNTFKDITKFAGMEYVHNTFQGIFIDVNKDNKLDLVVAYDTGEPRIYMNKGNNKFTLKTNPLTGKYSYPMGIGVGDYDNNQSPDFFFSNTGSTVPKMMAKGDLTKEQELFTDWILLNNDGNGNFSDTAKKTNIADFEFSWGAIFEDFNLDGKQDLVVAENYIAFPPQALFKLPCRFLVQQNDGTFAAVEQQAGVVNKNYAITPLSSDFNNDGYPDLIYSNLNGDVKTFISKKGNNNFVKVQIADKAKYIGAVVTLKIGNDKQTNYNIIGEGLCSDQSNTIIFGLGNQTKVESLTIKDINGSVTEIKNIKVNGTVKVN
jgi:hypothetical protein